MESVRIGHGYESPLGDYCGVRIMEDGMPKLEVRLSGTAAAVINANKNIYGEVYDWIEQVTLAIYTSGEVDSFYFVAIDSTLVNDKNYVIKNWRKFIK